MEREVTIHVNGEVRKGTLVSPYETDEEMIRMGHEGAEIVDIKPVTKKESAE